MSELEADLAAIEGLERAIGQRLFYRLFPDQDMALPDGSVKRSVRNTNERKPSGSSQSHQGHLVFLAQEKHLASPVTVGFGSNCDLQRPLEYRRFSARNETFGAERRQSTRNRT